MNFKESLKNIRALLLDVDGVLTDGSITLMENGDMVRTMNIKDGYAIQQAVKKGLLIGVITGARSEAVKTRLKYLGVQDVYIGAFDKVDVYKEYKEIYGLQDQEIMYMGDDMPDFEVMQRVGLPVCPADAVPEIRNLCVYVSLFNGGKGCVRDVVVQWMKSKELWMK